MNSIKTNFVSFDLMRNEASEQLKRRARLRQNECGSRSPGNSEESLAARGIARVARGKGIRE